MIGMTELQPAPSVSPASLAFGTAAATAIMQERAAMMAKGEVFKMSDIARIVAKLDSTRLDRPTAAIPAQSRPRKATGATTTRNALFDALAAACGITGKPTRSMGKRLGMVVAEIQEADPTVTPEEMTRRAGLIFAKYDKASCVAVSMHWHSCGGPRTQTAKRSIYSEPDNWRDVLRRIGKGWDQDMLEAMLTAEWLNISSTVRMDILKAISQ